MRTVSLLQDTLDRAGATTAGHLKSVVIRLLFDNTLDGHANLDIELVFVLSLMSRSTPESFSVVTEARTITIDGYE